MQRRVLDSKPGHRGPPYRLEFLSVGPPIRVPTSPSSKPNAAFNFLDQHRSFLYHDFSDVVGALHRYRVPVQGPSLAVQDTDHQVLRRSVVHLGHVRCMHGPLASDRRVLPHDCLRNHNCRHNVLLLQDRHEAERAEDDFDVHALERRPGYAQQCELSAGVQADDRRGLARGHLDHHCSAVYFCLPDFLRATSFHVEPEIRTFLGLLLTRWTHKLCAQPHRLCVALAELSFSPVAISSLPLTSGCLSEDRLALILCYFFLVKVTLLAFKQYKPKYLDTHYQFIQSRILLLLLKSLFQHGTTCISPASIYYTKSVLPIGRDLLM